MSLETPTMQFYRNAEENTEVPKLSTSGIFLLDVFKIDWAKGIQLLLRDTSCSAENLHCSPTVSVIYHTSSGVSELTSLNVSKSLVYIQPDKPVP